MKTLIRTMPNSRQRQRGAVAIIVGLCIVVLVGMIGLVLDLGHMFVTKTELQNAADSCALAAARELDGGTDALLRAENMGLTVGQQNKVDFQATAVSIAPADIQFSTTLSPNSSYLTRAGGAPVTSKYAMCTLDRTGIAMWFMQVLGFGDQAVAAQAVATLSPSQTTCAIPIGLCSQGPAPSFGFNVGQWYSGKFGSGATGTTGSYNWLDFSPPNGGASELKDLLAGPGQCELPPVGAPVGEQGQIGGLSDAWNTRFGIYKGGYDATSAPPDFTGTAYTNTALIKDANEQKKWTTTWPNPEPQNAYSGTPSSGSTLNYLAAQTARATYQSSDPANVGKTTSTGHANGANRRIAIAPVVNCEDLATSNPQQIPIRGYACVLMLNPIKGPDDVFLEFRGLANDPTSPCASFGIPGGTSGPLVPVLVQ